MGLTKCSACGHAVSAQAANCPACGHPLRRKLDAGRYLCRAAAVLFFGIAVVVVVRGSIYISEFGRMSFGMPSMYDLIDAAALVAVGLVFAYFGQRR